MNTIIFIYALILGSFFNVVGFRVPVHQSIVRPRSTCPACCKELSITELIPILSYLFQAGKCRNCKERISPLYPASELLTASLFLYAYQYFGWTEELLVAWVLISLLIIITVSDLAYMLIPDKILLAFIGIFLAIRIVQPLSPWWDSFVGASSMFLLLYCIALLSKGGLGGGDIKLMTVLGFLLGFKIALLAFVLAVLLGAFIGVIGLVTGFFNKKQPIPFGPFIALGTLLAYFYYDDILLWYTTFF